MRSAVLLAGIWIAASARAEGAAQKLDPPSEACAACHESEVDRAAFARSIHADLGCTACHSGYTAPGPHEPQALSPAETAAAGKLAQVSKVPRALLACAGCHETEASQLQGSIHGAWLKSERPVAGPTCIACHGPPHALTSSAGRSSAEGRARSARCETCHADPRMARAAGLSGEVAATYHDSIHGRLVAIGSTRAPSCADCHGSHLILSKSSPESPVVGANKARTCAKCHAGAGDNFAAVVSHRPLTEGKSRVPHAVHVLFSYLTTLTLLFFAFHVLIDLAWEIRRRFRPRSSPPPAGPEPRTVVRFDLHQRIQHWLMLTGVILLALTGWPLRGAGSPGAVEFSRRFLALFGGPYGAGLVHRFAALLVAASGAYHLVYLGTLAKKKRLPLSMLPSPKDLRDLRDNVLFLLGLRPERPRFDRFNYLEKFDYWAVFWGVGVMVGSGLLFWSPVFFARVLPQSMLVAAQIVHGEEATLAIMFLFVIHFYNVHLKPSIFPMNWTWLDGRVSLEAVKEEHPLEYERIQTTGDD